MDQLLPLLCLLIGITLPLAVLVGVVRRGMHQLDTAAAYRQVARHLGLRADTRGVSVQGHLGDRRLWIGQVMEGHGPDRSVTNWGVLDFTRPLGLGLLARRRGLSHRLRTRGRATKQITGHPALDALLELEADDADAIRRLLGHGTPAQRSLTALMKRWPDVILTDNHIRVKLKRPERTAHSLMALVEALVGFADAIESARATLKAPELVRSQVAPWQALGNELGLQCDAAYPSLRGMLKDRRVIVVPTRVEDTVHCVLRLFFHAHPDSGVLLVPQQAPDGYWSVGQDIQVGSTDFDECFVIKGWDPLAIRDLLTAETREALLALQATGALQLDDRGLEVHLESLEAAEVKHALSRMTTVADAIGW